MKRHYERPWYELYDGDKPIVVGHLNYLHNGEPLIWQDRVFAIDTGCCRGGRLTALILPEFRIVSVPSARNYWQMACEFQRARAKSLVTGNSPWEEIEEYLVQETETEDKCSQATILTVKLKRGDRAVDAVFGYVSEKNRQILGRLREKHDFRNLSRSQQAKLYNERVKDSPVAPLLHQARCGGLTRELTRRKLRSPGHALEVAEELGLAVELLVDDT